MDEIDRVTLASLLLLRAYMRGEFAPRQELRDRIRALLRPLAGRDQPLMPSCGWTRGSGSSKMRLCGCEGDRRCAEALRLLAAADAAWSRWRGARTKENWGSVLGGEERTDKHLDRVLT